jgi:hypothetical protein
MESTLESKLEKRRKDETTNVLKELISRLKEGSSNENKILQEIIRQTDKLALFLQKKAPQPNVTVNTDSKELVEAFLKVESTNLEIVANQEKLIKLGSMRPNKLKVLRNEKSGLIEFVEISWETLN